jgi:hypothetical protein
MRLKQQISTRLALAGAAALTAGLFASGTRVFASEQQPPQQLPPSVQTPEPVPGTGPDLRITADEAVRMALENNLGVQDLNLGYFCVIFSINYLFYV